MTVILNHRQVAALERSKMVDMRATERLLEVIEEQATKAQGIVAASAASSLGMAMEITNATAEVLDAITELRRRGDTLVRRDDLVRVIEHDCDYQPGDIDYALDIAARERLENAIGGKA